MGYHIAIIMVMMGISTVLRAAEIERDKFPCVAILRACNMLCRQKNLPCPSSCLYCQAAYSSDVSLQKRDPMSIDGLTELDVKNGMINKFNYTGLGFAAASSNWILTDRSATTHVAVSANSLSYMKQMSSILKGIKPERLY